MLFEHGLELENTLRSPALFVWHYTDIVAAWTDHYVVDFVRENVAPVMVLWRHYDVRKFNDDAILFGETQRRKNVILKL